MRTEYSNKQKDDSDDNEIALSAFDGKCYVCNQKGHKAIKCPKSGGQRGNGNNSGGGNNNGNNSGGGNNNGNNSGGGNNSGNNGRNHQNGGHYRRRIRGNCNECGKVGHMARDCWLRSENANRRPANFQMPSEQATPAVNSGTVEFLLSGMEMCQPINDEMESPVVKEVMLAKVEPEMNFWDMWDFFRIPMCGLQTQVHRRIALRINLE